MAAPHDRSRVGSAATWFDGRRATRHAVQLRLHGDALTLAGESAALPQRYALNSLVPGDRWPGLPWPVALPDGGTLWLDDAGAELNDALLARHARKSPARRLIERWPAVVVCVLCLLALVVWFDRQGAGMAAQTALRVLPRSVDQAVGVNAMQALDKQWLAASGLPLARRRTLAARLAVTAQRVAPQVDVAVAFRSLRGARGFNAIALPGGMIVVLDGLADGLTDDELLFVLGHEMGHVVHRHGMQAVMRSFGLVAVAAVTLGDFSSVAVGAASRLQNLRHSRDSEREADAFARRFAAQAGIGASAQASVWRKLAREEREAGTGGVPPWLSTHPTIEVRPRPTGVQGVGR